MTLPIIILTVLAVLSAGLFTVLRITHGGVVSLMSKTFASFCFVCLGVVVVFTHLPSDAGMFLILGLVCGMLGDILLDLKSVDKARSESYLNAGMLAFGFGHAFYLTFAILLNGNADIPLELCIAGVSSLLFTAVVMFFSRQLLGLKLGNFTFQASAYAFILSFLASFGVALTFANPKMLMFAIAMVAFLASDVVLSIMYFGGKHRNKVLSVTNHVLYYGAQIAIALFAVAL